MIITPPSPSLHVHLNPVRMVAALWQYRDLARQLAWRDLMCRCRSGAGGIIWMIGSPLALLAVYTLVFNGSLGVQWSRGVNHGAAGFALTAFCGMTVFFFVADCLQRAPLLMSAHAGMVKKSTVPLEILPFAMVLGTLPGLAGGIGIAVVATLCMNGTVPATAVLVVPVLLPLLAGVLGTSWLLAGVGAYFRSCHHVLVLVFNVLFFATPVLYDPSRVPARWQILMTVNPLAFAVDNVRRVLLWGLPPDWIGLGVWMAVGWLVMVVGHAAFMGTRRGFADVL